MNALNFAKENSMGNVIELKIPETRQVQERLLSTLEQLQVLKWGRTRCSEE